MRRCHPGLCGHRFPHCSAGAGARQQLACFRCRCQARPSPEASSCRKATHRGQRLHVGAHQTEVADHVENPVVGGQVQRCAAILQDTEKSRGF